MKINNIALFFGGFSNERYISINSGYEIFKSLFNLGFNVYPVDTKYLSFNFFLKKNIDKVFIALHGYKGEDGSLQGLLDYLNIPYTGSGVFASSICIDKYKTKIFLSKFNINVLPGLLIKKNNINIYNNNFYFNISLNIGFPIILKPNYYGSSIGINIVYNSICFKNKLLKYINKFGDFLIEKYIYGEEYTVGVLDGIVLPPIKIIKNNCIFNYNLKYKIKCKYLFNTLNKKNEIKIKNFSRKIWNILNCKGCIRIDYIIDKNNKIWFLELNTIPGMTKNSLIPLSAKYYGINYNNLVKKILFSK